MENGKITGVRSVGFRDQSQSFSSLPVIVEGGGGLLDRRENLNVTTSASFTLSVFSFLRCFVSLHRLQ